MSETAAEWETVSRTELSQLRRDNAALRAHIDRLEDELEESYGAPLSFWERLILTVITLSMVGLMCAGLIWTASRVFR